MSQIGENFFAAIKNAHKGVFNQSLITWFNRRRGLKPNHWRSLTYNFNLAFPPATLCACSFSAQALSCLSIFTSALGLMPNACAAAFVSPFLVAMMSNTCATNSGNSALLVCMCPLLPGKGISVAGGVSRTFRASAICMRCSAWVLFSFAFLASQDLISKLY